MTTDVTQGYPRGADGTYHAAGRLVVDSGDVETVLTLLSEGEPHREETIDELALTLVAVSNVDAALAALPEPTGHYATRRGGDELERLMAAVRSEGDRRSGHVPLIGKDRVVLGGEALPYISPKVLPQAAYGPFANPGGRRLAAGVTAAAGDGVKIGVLDTWVIDGAPFADEIEILSSSGTASGPIRRAWQGHGTFVTGLIHGRAPGARIVVRPVLAHDEGVATAWEAAKGMTDLVRDGGVHMINMSLGCVTGDQRAPFALQRAVERLRDQVLLVAAAGNYDPEVPEWAPLVWPAALEGVLSVGSITEQGAASPFSPDEPWVDVVAVGENVTSDFASGDVVCVLRGGGTRTRTFWGSAIWSGTSFAAATVTGRVAALAVGCTGDVADALRDLAQRLRTGAIQDDVVRQP